MTNPELSPNNHDKHFDKNTNQHSRLIAEWIWDACIIRCAGKFSWFHNFLVQALIFYGLFKDRRFRACFIYSNIENLQMAHFDEA